MATRDVSITYQARWIFPVSGPPIPNGLLRIVGDRIDSVAPEGTMPVDVNLGNVAVVPGFVNAHTHLDLSHLRGQITPSDEFTQWLRQVIASRRQMDPEAIEAIIRAGLTEALDAGTTLIGDICGSATSWNVLSNAPCWAVAYREVLGLTEERMEQSLVLLHRWLHDHPNTETCRSGISPHAPYSVRVGLFEAIADLARKWQFPVQCHVAESMEELILLAHQRGPFVEFLEELGVWDPDGLLRDHIALFDCFDGVESFGAVHANYLGLTAHLAQRPNSTRIYCPRTHAAFGFSQYPLAEANRPGMRFALGTDSLASNPDLDIFAEACFIHHRYPTISGATILRMLTLHGAETLGFADRTGSLSPGKSADCVLLPLPDSDADDPHALLFAAGARPCEERGILWRGQWRREIAPR
ncbi:amidohydrolase family protein [Tuwongella immobilis]|uniref:Amidohydrolase-related domain-containing protein n=1 Tax=Tuwongella immobilis TaxID=692036 RepID=A0A6C2YNR0_9BACT|nr:amidohydrolase family protein [Tuwongella immobilis]VIP02522.1 amidohydrolase : Probable chlorohydrolase OS=Planctomyces maris DSM 8797 GN=PM8797T_06812 PE=4 SV=1: Amidohydro_1 [Tuwongella immobilis]VTS01655.1 amidohydrolase : Probable chlorohydrolase OS=Planctomyces maris DSM 8797 GN=PM8797T_06812 PE=4 SV=1: Amidohydro_1 [Tuwongella immobilis]